VLASMRVNCIYQYAMQSINVKANGFVKLFTYASSICHITPVAAYLQLFAIMSPCCLSSEQKSTETSRLTANQRTTSEGAKSGQHIYADTACMQATEQKATMLSSINNTEQLYYTAVQHRMQTNTVQL